MKVLKILVFLHFLYQKGKFSKYPFINLNRSDMTRGIGIKVGNKYYSSKSDWNKFFEETNIIFRSLNYHGDW